VPGCQDGREPASRDWGHGPRALSTPPRKSIGKQPASGFDPDRPIGSKDDPWRALPAS